MHRFALRAAVLGMMTLLLAAAVKAESITPGTYDKQIVVGGETRTYRVYVPAGYGPGGPSMISLHGTFADGPLQEKESQFSKLADEKGFLVVYPTSRGSAFAIAGPALDQDVAFIDALITEIKTTYAGDGRRIYCNGMSNGAIFTNLLAMRLPGKFAAIGIVCGSIPIAAAQSENPPATPVIHFHGTADAYVPYAGTDSLLSVEEEVQWWVGKNAASSPPAEQQLPDTVPEDQVTAQSFSYAGPAPVVFYKMTNGGHTWPGNPAQPEAILGKICLDIDASRLMWDFFSAFPKNVAPVITSGPTATPNPAEVDTAVTFVASAQDADGGSLTYSWDFGDGTGSAEVAPMHAYSAAGSFAATVTVTDAAGASVTAMTIVEVKDVVSPPPTAKTFQTSTLTGKANLKKPGKDSFSLSGRLTLPPEFAPAGQTAVVTVAGARAEFVLTEKGRSKSPGGSFTLRQDRRDPASWSFTASSGNGDWADVWTQAGLAVSGTVTVGLSVEIGGDRYESQASVKTTASDRMIRFKK